MIATRTSFARYVDSFKESGYVVIEDALPGEVVARLRKKFMEVMNDKVSRSGIAPYLRPDPRHEAHNEVLINFRPEGGNHDFNRWNMHLPSSELFLDSKIIAHPQIVSVLQALFDDPICFMIASDTPFPNSGFQSIHQDGPCFAVTVNIPLVDCTEDNAPLEVWPGSNSASFSKEPARLLQNEIEKFISLNRSESLLPKMGAVIMRDQRLLHRGTVNRTPFPRPFLSLWFKERPKQGIPDRSVSDRFARRAREIRDRARRSPFDERMLNLGNYLGRLVDEIALSDRNYRRPIPAGLWSKLKPEARKLLRFASIAPSGSNEGGLSIESRTAINPALDRELDGIFRRLAG